MRVILDKLVLLLCCSALIALEPISAQSVVIILIAITLSSLNSFFSNRHLIYANMAVYWIICILYPQFCIYLPLIYYDVFVSLKLHWSILGFVPVLVHCTDFPTPSTLLIIIFLGVSYLIKHRSNSLSRLETDYKRLRDTSKELSLLMESKNKDLLEKQDYEVRLAMLNERNRIAREIHDNVGHMLSRSILQVGALIALNKDEAIKQNLAGLKDTLSQAMDSIRRSVHDLHDESIDLYSQVISLTREFSFCAVSLDYDIEGEVEKNLKYCFISIIKEALSNVIKHSNATQVRIILREHPAIYQLIVQDNGTQCKNKSTGGIGLQNITDRVNAFNGTLNIEQKSGFKIFISFPKRRKRV